MDPNYPYYPPSSGAAQMTGYHTAGPAAPAGVGPGPSQGASQQLDRLAQLTGLTPAMIQRMIRLRATEDPDLKQRKSMQWTRICDILRNEFGNEMKFNADGLNVRWQQHIRPTLTEQDVRVRHKLHAEARAGPAQGSRGRAQPGSVDPPAPRGHAYRNPPGSFQNVHALSYGAPPSAPGAPYSGMQPFSRGGPPGEPQSGHDRQYGAPQSSSVNPYLNTSGANPRPSPFGFSNQPLDNRRLPPINSFWEQPGYHGAPPPEPQYPMPNQNYNAPAQQETAPGMQGPLTWYRTSRGGSSSQAPRGRAAEQTLFDQNYRFSDEEQEWIMSEGMCLGPGIRETQEFYERYRRQFEVGDHRVPSMSRVMDEFNSMRG